MLSAWQQALGKEGRDRTTFHGQPMPSVDILPRVWHSAKKSFAECPCLPSAILCRVQHSAKQVFAECSIFNTQQRILHSAKYLFLVVTRLLSDSSWILSTFCVLNRLFKQAMVHINYKTNQTYPYCTSSIFLCCSLRRFHRNFIEGQFNFTWFQLWTTVRVL